MRVGTRPHTTFKFNDLAIEYVIGERELLPSSLIITGSTESKQAHRRSVRLLVTFCFRLIVMSNRFAVSGVPLFQLPTFLGAHFNADLDVGEA